MTDKEKRKFKAGVISKFSRFNILDNTATIGGLRDDILRYIDSLQEEPVSEELENELNKYIKDYFTIDREQLDRFGIEEKDYMYSMDKSDMLALVEHFTKWQQAKDEAVTKDLGDYINELSKQFPEVSFAKLSRIAVRVAKWQKGQMMANAIDGTARPDDNEIWCNLTSNNLEDGDKVKVIVIKED